MSNHIDHLMHEDRRFPPPTEFAANAVATGALYDAARTDRLGFWADQARTVVSWSTPFTRVLDWSGAPFAQWFDDGRLRRDVAEGRPIGDTTTLTDPAVLNIINAQVH